ncbi:MAG: RNA-binding S4 domain-containing protein [Deinococcales bacterium]
MDDAPTIRLDDVLKLAGIAATGGQAKQLIQSGQVKVNGALETRRKHLLRQGDEVTVGDEVFVVELGPEADEEPELD